MRLIDADKLKEYVNSISSGFLCEWDTLGVLSAIDKQQTVDAVPVVRCVNCKNARHDTKYLINENLYYCMWHEETHNPNWYCADGEQKDGEHNETN